MTDEFPNRAPLGRTLGLKGHEKAIPLPFLPSDLNKISPALVLLSILWLGFGLRLYRLGDQNIWWDEGHAIWAARQSLAQATDITAHDVHPPLYLWMLHDWLRVTGESEFAVRYLSVIGGMLTVALTYVVARRTIGRRAALLATLLIATARFHIWWSQEARMYIWATFFVLLSIYYMIRLRHSGYIAWWLYVISSTAALYTLYLAVLALLLENLFVALTVWRKPQRRRFLFNWGLAQLSILLLYTPWLYIALSQTRTDTAKTAFPFHLIWQLYGTLLATGISTHLDRYVWLLIPFGVLIIVGLALFFLDRRQPQRYSLAGWEIGLLLLLPLILPPVVVYGLSIPRGVFYSPKPEARYLLIFAPLVYTLLAGIMACFWQRGRWGRAITLGTMVLILGTFVSVLPGHYAGRYLRDEFRTAMWTLAAYAQPDDAVLLVSGDRYPVFLYHYHRRFPDGDGPTVYLLPQRGTRFTPENVEHELAPLSERHPRLWLASVERALQDPDDLVREWLDARRTPVLSVAQGHNDLKLYTVENVEPTIEAGSVQPQHPLARPLGTSMLIGYDLPTKEFRPGDSVNLGLYVRTATGPLDLAVDWIAENGQAIAQQTISASASVSSERTIRMMATFTVYTYTAPGRYWFEVYDPGNGTERIRLPAGRVTQSRHLPVRKIGHSQRAQIQDGLIQFLGYDMRPSSHVQAGKILTLDLYWLAQRRLDKDYTVFVHLLGPYNPATGGPVWAQDDSQPLDGGHPTTRWLPGQVVADRHPVRIPRGTLPGTFQVEVGLYDALTGERLHVAGSDENRILLSDIQITR